MKVFKVIIFSPLALIRLFLIFMVSAITVFLGTCWLWLFGFSRKLQKNVLQLWGRSLLIICGIRVSSNEIFASGQYLIMSNHRSYLDIFVFAAYVPSAFVAKSEVQEWPMMKSAALITNIIFVSREELKSLISTMHRIRQAVSGGIPVVLFPEGTTYKGPLTKPFKKGSFKIAADSGIPVIPAAIHFDNTDDAWVDDDTFVGHFFRQMGKPVTNVHLKFGQPVADADPVKLRSLVQESINTLLLQIQAEK